MAWDQRFSRVPVNGSFYSYDIITTTRQVTNHLSCLKVRSDKLAKALKHFPLGQSIRLKQPMGI